MRLILPIVLALLVIAPAADANPSQITFFEAPRELRSDDAALRAATLADIDSLGARWLRVNLFWRDVAPDANRATAPAIDDTDPAAYDWALYDRMIDEARQQGLNVMVTISGPVPRWATKSKKDQVTRPSPARFEAFATAVGRKYGDVVDKWSIYNEPNLPGFLKPQFAGGKVVSGSIYRGLYAAGRRGLAASGNGADPVLIGETAPRGTSKTAAPLAFLRDTLGLTKAYKRKPGIKKLAVDGWAHHPYTSSAGPGFVPRAKDDVTIGTLSRLSAALDRAARAGAIRRRVPIWITEFGIQSVPDPFIGVSEIQQARFRSLSERIAFRNPRVRSFAQYLLRDDLPRGGSRIQRYSGFESGLRFSGGRAKLAFDDFRLPLVADRAGRKVKLWGLVRPASGRTRVTIEINKGGAWKTLTTKRTTRHTNWSATTPYRAGAQYRVRWQSFTGAPTRAA